MKALLLKTGDLIEISDDEMARVKQRFGYMGGIIEGVIPLDCGSIINAAEIVAATDDVDKFFERAIKFQAEEEKPKKSKRS